MIEELRSSLASLVSSYTGAKNSIKRTRDTNPLISKPTLEEIEQNLKTEIQNVFNTFKTKLNDQLTELKKAQQLSSIMLIGNPINDTITNLINDITSINAYLDGINLDDFCKEFDKRTGGKLKIDDLMADVEAKINLDNISQTIENVNTQVLDAVRTTFVKQREALNNKINEVQTNLDELAALFFIPEIENFISLTTPSLAPARACTHDQIDAQMRILEGIDFAQFDKAKDKFKAEKQAFEDKKFGDLKAKLEALKAATPTLAPLIDPLLDSFKTIESPATMSLETFEKDETKLFAPIEATITAFITQQANSMTDLSPFHYAIDPSKLGDLNQLITELNSITELTPEKLEKAVAIQQVAAEIRTNLKAKKLLADDDKSHRLDSPNDRLVGELGAISQDILAERSITRNISDQTSEQDLQKRLENLRQRCANLQGKDGHIDAHQREIALQRSLLIRDKNAEILNRPSIATTSLANDIKNTISEYNNITGQDTFDDEKYRVAQQSTYENQIFKQKNRAQRTELLNKRKTIIDANKALALTPEQALASVTSIQVNTAKFLLWDVKWKSRVQKKQDNQTKKQHTTYQNDLKKVLNQLKEIDKKLLGNKRATEIYDPIFERIPYLLGGTQVMIPQHLIDLQESLVMANNTFKH